MLPTQDVLAAATPELSWTEVPRENLGVYREQLLETLEAICGNPIFSSSPKSSAFLQHVVLRTLSGDADELKERLIGMALLGRDPSYDTSSDAGVRVRANDVRKRLAKLNESDEHRSGFVITLPAGTYVPRVFRAATAEDAPAPQANAPLHADWPLRLSFFQLALPTLVALFLCIVCMRWQLAQEHHVTAKRIAVLGGKIAP